MSSQILVCLLFSCYNLSLFISHIHIVLCCVIVKNILIVQDNLSRVVCNSNRSTSAGPLLRSLHWLPVRQRINFKLAKLCYLATSFQQPGYLADLISPYSQSRLLRSSTQKLLSVPPHNLDTAARRFSVAAPRLWNSLPLNCRTAPSVNTFKIRLKTFLFDSA